MNNRLTTLFERKKKRVLNIYLTAGYPELNDTKNIVLALDKAGADMVELGMPYSDPMADGETIQLSSARALSNGMTLELLFQQVKDVRLSSEIPIVLMGYFNQMMQYGLDSFMSDCNQAGVDGLIIPDLPMDIYEQEIYRTAKDNNLGFSFLITPQTSDERIVKADKLSSGFLYVVSQASITGKSKNISQEQIQYFQRIQNLGLKSPCLIGFGIHDKTSFDTACNYSSGAIVGSAFIRAISKTENKKDTINNFVHQLIN